MSIQSKQEDTITFLGVGDVGSDWYKHNPPQEIYRYVEPIISKADIAFAHQEGIWSEKDDSRQDIVTSGMHRQQLNYAPLLAKCGFNVVSVASNHAFMYGPNEFITNIENHRRAGIATAGGGKNSGEAREPAILERKGIRVAVLAYISNIPIEDASLDWAAGENWTGVAPMRYHTFYKPTVLNLPGWPNVKTFTIPYPEDLEAIQEDIRKAKTRADVVVVSIHGGIPDIPKFIADYQIELTHTVIDAGADLVLCHHAHILKGIEMYKGKVCFYGLCHFLHVGPRERFAKHRLAKVSKVQDPGPDWPLYVYHPDARMTVVVKCLITKQGIQRVSFLPAAINGLAQPRILTKTDQDFEKTVQYVRDITADYFKTSFEVDGDEVVIG